MNNVNLELFGEDPKIQKALQIAGNVSSVKVPVLIVGEAGVGKRTLANHIHNSSARADKTLELVDCAQDSQLVENTILGYRDENSNRFVKGVLERANGGTIILSNVDNLEENFQKRIHQIFNELADYDIDIRIICTTSKNLSKLVGSGRFYRGLYTYIAANQIYLSPLRERLADLEFAFDYFLSKSTDEKMNVTQEAKNRLLKHYWTHNLLEVQSVIEATLRDLEGNTIEESDLCIGERKLNQIAIDNSSDGISLMSLKEAEKLLIQKALVHTSENRTQAAKILGVSIRTLRNKINEYRSSGTPYFVNLR